MSDFDFDEIDKAVAGALGGTDEPSFPMEEPSASSSRETGAAEKAPSIKPEPTKPEDEPAKPRTSLASRRGAGRFMDVMHPSSDMRTRQAASSPKPMMPTPTEAPSEQKEGALELERNEEPPRRGGLHSADVHSSAPMSTQVSAHREVEEEGDNTSEAASPLASPFLTDAKIEKRPLGSAAPTGAFTAPTVEEELDFDDFEPKVTTLPVADDEQEPPLLLEAAEDFFLESGEEEVSPQEPETSSMDVDTPEQEHEVPTYQHEPVPVVDEDTPVGPTSIKQQYEERPVESGESGAIYDTENYHQPVAYPEKKRAGAWTILWISLLVIFGAGVGVAFYLFVLPTL